MRSMKKEKTPESQHGVQRGEVPLRVQGSALPPGGPSVPHTLHWGEALFSRKGTQTPHRG